MDIKLWISILSGLGMLLGGLTFLLWSIWSGFRKRHTIATSKLEEAHTALVQVKSEEAAAWKSRFETEREEFAGHRQKAHDAANIANAKILQMAEENAQLRGKTDLTPVIRFHEEQGEINSKVVASLDAILERLNGCRKSKKGTQHAIH